VVTAPYSLTYHTSGPRRRAGLPCEVPPWNAEIGYVPSVPEFIIPEFILVELIIPDWF